jgi:hypothetical protein
MNADDETYAAVKAARSPELNRRCAAHESSHAVLGRAFGSLIELVTIVPDDVFAGRCVRRGAPSTSLNLLNDQKVEAATTIKMATTTDLIEVCERIGAPELGTPRVGLAEEITRAQTHVIELLGGSVGERVMFPDLPPLPAEHDRIEARALAYVVCASPAAVDALLAYCEAEAEALIRANIGIVSALTDALLEKGTLVGEEVDQIISATVAAEMLAAEQARRRQWQQRARNAAQFKPG